MGESEGSQLPQYRVLICKTVTKEQLSCCITVRLQTRGCKTKKTVSDVEQKVMGGTEKTGDVGLGFIEGTFNSRHKSHVTDSCKNICFGEETFQRPPKLAVQ